MVVVVGVEGGGGGSQSDPPVISQMVAHEISSFLMKESFLHESSFELANYFTYQKSSFK